ncbi:hypothetical protein GGR02_002864 [Anoxybacillus voinovskiensis]|uniref:Uncharacterized protein n=1 Tax=Anoxybacteroides voinovskiense TaxID=230470 RepID=A0A840DTS8_9BACL|nr:hypothetical protein [Anoxybacillus voinovskiensis]
MDVQYEIKETTQALEPTYNERGELCTIRS